MSIPQTSALTGAPGTGAQAERVGELRERILGMQRDRWEVGGRSVSAGLASVLPTGSLRHGVVYSVQNSTSLIMSILGSVSADGGWCAVVGMPDFGSEAAVDFGIDLERLVLIPSPGDAWMAVTAALVDVLPLVVVRAEGPIADGEAARLGARLRQTGCTLIVAGAWPQNEAALSVTSTRWAGLGSGHGYLSDRELDVEVRGRNGGGARRHGRLHLPEGPENAYPGPHRATG